MGGNRIALTGTDISFNGTLAEATRESTPFEIAPPGLTVQPTQTVWWEWTAPESTTVIVQILNSSKETHRKDGLQVYTLENIYTGQFIAGVTLDSVWPVEFFSFQADAGTNYQIQLSGTDSASFSFRLIATNSPYIVNQPQSQTVSINDSVMFGVVAAGSKPFGYQWQHNGTNLTGETAPILGMDHVTTNQAGAYRVVVTNSFGTNISETAQLFVTPTDTAPSLAVTQPQNSIEFRFSLLGEIGRRYRIESSTNLTDWSPESSFPSIFNYYHGDLKSVVADWTGADSFAFGKTKAQSFIRTSPFHAINEECNNNLKQLRFAHLLYAYNSGFDPFSHKKKTVPNPAEKAPS